MLSAPGASRVVCTIPVTRDIRLWPKGWLIFEHGTARILINFCLTRNTSGTVSAPLAAGRVHRETKPTVLHTETELQMQLWSNWLGGGMFNSHSRYSKYVRAHTLDAAISHPFSRSALCWLRNGQNDCHHKPGNLIERFCIVWSWAEWRICFGGSVKVPGLKQ